MTYLGSGLAQMHNFLRTGSGTNPSYMSFGASSLTSVSGSETISNMTEFIRNSITWSQSGNNSAFYVDLATSEANGSYLSATGLSSGSSIGSGILHTLNVSQLGSKTNLFSISLQGEVIIQQL